MRFALFRPRRGERERCSLCHEPSSGAVVSCEGCGTLCHEACLRELGGCPTLGCLRGRAWSELASDGPGARAAFETDAIHLHDAGIGRHLFAGCISVFTAALVGAVLLAVYNLIWNDFGHTYLCLAVPLLGVFAVFAGSSIAVFRRNPRTFVAGVLDVALLGFTNPLLRRRSGPEGTSVELRHHLPGGLELLEASIPVEELGTLRAYRAQGSIPSNPRSTLSLETRGGATYYVDLPEQDARAVIQALEKWRADAKTG